MAVSSLAAPSDPGETAVHFLEKVRAKNLNLEPGGDTALSPQTSETKRKEIARRLERMARDLGSDPLEVGAVKLDDELAAVLVRKLGGFDPSRLQIFPIALVKRGAEWAAAPVPGSFENAGVGYAASLRQRLTTLQDWMLREQVVDLENLREQSAARMRRKIEESLPAATLRNFTPQQAAERFLTACEQRNLPEIFGLLGGLARTLPNDWSLRLKAAEAAMTAAEAKYPWRLLISNDVLRVPVHQEEDEKSAMVSVACLDPASGPAHSQLPRIELVHLELSKSGEGLWRIDPPRSFFQDREPADRGKDNLLDADLLDAFPAKLAALHPPSLLPDARETRQALISGIQEGNLASILHFIRLDGDPGIARESCVRAAQIWWALRDPSAVRRAVPLAVHEDGNTAAGAFQFFSARDPDHLDLRIFYFEKTEHGWLWTPKPKPETENSFGEWAGLQSKQWQDHWQQEMLRESIELDQIPDAGAPTEDECRKLIESWMQATRSGDVMAAMRLTARLKTKDSKVTALRCLGYELTGARLAHQPGSITGVRRGAILAAAAVKTDTDDKPVFPFYPIVSTPSGPRILIEINLLASANRSRDYLNRNSLEQLRKSSPAAADELAKLFAEHQSSSIEKTNP